MSQIQPYQTIKNFPDFELRHYPKGLQIETRARGDFLSAGNSGFGPLISFISGANQNSQKIAMTAPVIQESITDSEHLVRFVLPEDLKLPSSPQPLDSRVKVVEVESHLAACRRFSGSWNQDRFQKEAKLLVQAVLTAGLVTIGSVYFARYDPPWKPGFLKRNEVLIKIKE
jgi:hypothetical protein